MPTKLTREQMEERRREGARLLRQGKVSQGTVARQLGVSRMSVSRWDKQLAMGGLRALHRRSAPGRPPRLSEAQSQRLLRQLQRGAQKAGFPTEQWTLARIQQLMQREFKVTYHVGYLCRWLEAHGWSVQHPIARAAERDEEMIRAWLLQDWPRIKKSAAVARRHCVL